MSARRARRLPLHRGPAAWSAILPGQPAPESLAGRLTVDFAVIGAGFAGLSAARRLRQLNPQARIAVLDAGRLAEGASGRNSGFMIDLPHDLSSKDYSGSGDDHTVIRLNRQAISFAREAMGEYGIDPAFFDPCGKVNGAVSAKAEAHNLSYTAHLEKLGEAAQMLDNKEMFRLTGSHHYRSGLFTPGTVLIQPAGYIRGFGTGLRREGVSVFENSPVVRIGRTGPDWCLHTPKGQIMAAKLILANNGHLESFGFARGRLMHVFLFASMTPDLDSDALARLGGAARWGITPSDPMGTTMRRIDTKQGGNRIITRTCALFEPGMQVSAAAVSRAAEIHRRKFLDRYPQLHDIGTEYQWAGHLCLSRNGVSVMRELEPGLFSACCQNGLGTTRGTLTGIGAAELASGHESGITRHFIAEAEPTRLPPEPLARIGANAYLKWREWVAAKE
ncbi:NAD(P)/FAD-dependent oxidoreductase [Paracoccus onubensis]|uniref:FAD-binding oxidoreductase n=1 Tax=Paracoccus onubensis TaxID=1675788 RepID=A0A418SVN9_9RHOB|nr:FAD-binding oxidoreductase [Paracoccus onubensis]RJE84985.1 FAD-binding oxidoreductase [Paracoccus onubensis]